jgi:hypothetical protein
LLTQAQRDAWDAAGPKVQSAKRLGSSGPLTGQQHFQGINSARARLGLDMLLMPPAPVAFGPNPVGQLAITNGEGGVRLLLNISTPPAEDIMVFGQAPCNSGRRKRRNVSYLGLLPAPQAGLSDITDLYIARYGEPAAGQRVFIVTRQQKDGWEGFDQETHEIVPDKPADQQATAAEALPSQPKMYKGGTRDAQGVMAPSVQESGAIAPRQIQDEAGSRRSLGTSSSMAKRPPTTPPACDTATGSPMRPKCRKVKNIRPLIASTAALPTTSRKLISPMRRSVDPGGWPATDSNADTAIRPWAMPESPHRPLVAMPGAAAQETSRLPAPAAIRQAVGADYPWPGNVRELEQATRRILLTGDYTGSVSPKSVGLREQLVAGIEAGTLNADALLAGYCQVLYEREGTYEAVARRTNLDRRTVKSYLLRPNSTLAS